MYVKGGCVYDWWSVLSNRHVVWTSRCVCLLMYVCMYVCWVGVTCWQHARDSYVCMCVLLLEWLLCTGSTSRRQHGSAVEHWSRDSMCNDGGGCLCRWECTQLRMNARACVAVSRSGQPFIFGDSKPEGSNYTILSCPQFTDCFACWGVSLQLHVRTYVCMYVCMYVCTYVCMYCMYVCTYCIYLCPLYSCFLCVLQHTVSLSLIMCELHNSRAICSCCGNWHRLSLQWQVVGVSK